MKKTIVTFALLALLFSSCGNKNTSSSDVYQEINEQQVNSTLTYVTEAQTLNELLQKQEPPVQTFQVSSKKPSKITGRYGTVIHIRPSALETIDGEPVGDKIDIVLKECTNQEELFRGNVQTVSNGELLVSGGAYYVNMTSDGKQLRIKAGQSIEMDFPVLADEEMEFFYGERDSLGRMNWIVADQVLERREPVAAVVETAAKPVVIFEAHGVRDTMRNFSQEEFDKQQAERLAERAAAERRRQEEQRQRERETKLRAELYNSISVTQLGWINVDRFIRTGNTTDVAITVENGDVVNATAIYLVFKDINSVMNIFGKKNAPTNFVSIPVGYDVRLVAFATDESGDYYSYSCDFTIQRNERRSIKLKKTDDKDWNKLFDLSNWCGENAKRITVVD